MSCKKVFTVFDQKAGMYLVPMFQVSRGVAQRLFLAAVKDREHEFGKFPEDFSLFELGEYDESCAEFRLHGHPELLMTGLQARALEANQ